jgi:hypothetical protein
MMQRNRTTIWRWFQAADRGGSDGMVPTRALAKLMGLAREHGIFLGDEDLRPRLNPDHRTGT